MNTSNNLREIETQAYRTLWEDGLLDIVVGAGVVGLGVSWITGFAIYGAILPALLVPVWQASRKRIIEPRMGYVEFSRERQAQERRGLSVLVLLGALTLTLGVVAFLRLRGNPSEQSDLLPVLIPALPAALLGVGGALVGLLFAIRRFLTYAMLLFVGAAVGAGLGAWPGWHFVVPGLVILSVGVTLLAQFLRKYPTPEVEGLS